MTLKGLKEQRRKRIQVKGQDDGKKIILQLTINLKCYYTIYNLHEIHRTKQERKRKNSQRKFMRSLQINEEKHEDLT